MITKEKKNEVISGYRVHERDTGSAEIQVALLTERINALAPHFKSHMKDHHSRRGLLKMVGRRRSLLDFLKGIDSSRYQALIERLNIRK
ncbi:MAG: 30S ribosomal protein S15 [Deltaproteobacteria bacterium]|nr:30S ribosomal protein S15 [Deltaproteobacteria bacterium]MBI3294305.1 30S ribosomal protein S15 [Deltaproteobacteria bacterium]